MSRGTNEMKRRLRLAIAALEAVLLLVDVYCEPTHAVRGILWGEAFFEGKPTSYWRADLERWEVIGIVVTNRNANDGDAQLPWKFALYQRKPTLIEKLRERWFPEP